MTPPLPAPEYFFRAPHDWRCLTIQEHYKGSVGIMYSGIRRGEAGGVRIDFLYHREGYTEHVATKRKEVRRWLKEQRKALLDEGFQEVPEPLLYSPPDDEPEEGRLLTTGQEWISSEQAYEVLHEHHFAEGVDLPEAPVLLCESWDCGEGALHLDEGELCVVRGSISAEEITTGYGSILIVMGGVKCKHADFSGEVAIRGTLRADECVLVCSSNDYGFFAEAVEAKLFYETGTASYLGSASGAVWRTINEVRVGETLVPKREGTIRRTELVQLGLSDDVIELVLRQ